jgi:hypothetical protein
VRDVLRCVNIRRCYQTGTFVLNPDGTFRGYGAYVGINPYRELVAGVGSGDLGAAVMRMLELSGPTGVGIAEARTFLESSADDETRRVRAAHHLDAPRLSTAMLARRFAAATVELRHGQRSWWVQGFRYDPRTRTLSGERIKPVRVLLRAGTTVLGEVVREVLGIEPTDPGRESSCAES